MTDKPENAPSQREIILLTIMQELVRSYYRIDHPRRAWTPSDFGRAIKAAREYLEQDAAGTPKATPSDDSDNIDYGKCGRCEEWQQMGLSNTCPDCDLIAAGEGGTGEAKKSDA